MNETSSWVALWKFGGGIGRVDAEVLGCSMSEGVGEELRELRTGGSALAENERDQVLSDYAGWNVREHVSQFADQAILAFRSAQVGALDMVQHVEAREREGRSDKLPRRRGSIALHQSGGVGFGRARRYEHPEASDPRERAGAEDRLSASVVAVEHEHDGRCEALEREDLLGADGGAHQPRWC